MVEFLNEVFEKIEFATSSSENLGLFRRNLLCFDRFET